MHVGRTPGTLAVTLLAAGLAATGCGSSNSTSSTGSSSSSSPSASAAPAAKSGTIALLLPETKTTRYESADRPFFTDKMKSLCADCKVVYSNANQDAALQQNQADQALTNGAKVLVLDPVDSASAASIVAKAKAQNVQVVSYDRLITNAPIDYFVGFDSVKVGQLQGQALLDKLTKDGTAATGQIVWINGSPTDNNAKQFKQGAHSVLDGKVKIAKEYDTPDWSPDKAQSEMEQAITAVGKTNIVGVYAANGGTAGGAVAAMKAAGMPQLPVTGQDAEIAGLQRVLSGDQYMTVYKAVKPEAEAAAQLAYDLLQGKTPANASGNQNNGTKDVPSILLDVQSITKANVNVPIKDGFRTASDICTAQYADACKSAGIS